MGRKRKTRWRRLSIGEISANEDEDGELGAAVISLTRSHSASQNHSPARHPSDKSLSAIITMTNNNKDSSSSPSLHNSSTNLTTAPGSGSNTGGGPTVNSSGSASGKILSSSSASANPDKTQIPSQNSSSSSPNPHSGYHNGHHHSVPTSYNNSTHPPPNSVSSNESGCGSTSSSIGGGGGGHYNDRYHYTRENYRPPHHHHHHHHHHNSHQNSYNGSSSHYQGSGEGGSSSRSDRGGSYHYSGHPHGHKDYQNGYHGTGHYSGYQGSTYYRNSHNNYRNSHYSGGGSAGGGSGGEPYNGGESEGYHYPSSRPYGGRFRKSRTYPASSYYYANGSSKSGGTGNNTTDNINRPSYNQDEYTKITTPRQDVLFKKGYLSQKKTQPSSSSVDSASAATTPSASTNGTPDTQSTNGINSDNSEGYENGETDYVIPYDDTIYYGPPPPEAVFTDPNTGQVYYGHCSSTGEYYDAYPVSPVMVAAGYPPVYYPMMPYAPIDWNSVQAPIYTHLPITAAPQLASIEDLSQFSPGLQGLESSPATTTNPNTNSDTTPSASAAGDVATTTTSCTTPSSSVPNPASGADAANPETIIIPGNALIAMDSGDDCGSSVGDEVCAVASHESLSGAEEECGGQSVEAEHQNSPIPYPEQKNNMNNYGGIPPSSCTSSQDQFECDDTNLQSCSYEEEQENKEDNNNDGMNKQYEIVEGVEKLHLGKNEGYSSSESVLSSASSSTSGEASPPTPTSSTTHGQSQISGQGLKSPSIEENDEANSIEIDEPALSPSSPNAITNSNPSCVKNVTAMMISSQHHPHLTTAGLSYPIATTSGPHPQGIPVAAAPVMTTVPVPMGCPPVMIATAPNGMTLPPLVHTAPLHPMQHPPPQQQGAPAHHHHHPHANHHHGQHHLHHSNHPHPMHHHPPPNHQHHQQQHGPSHGPPPHHSNYSHHHRPRHIGPPHPHHHIPHHQSQQPHHNSPHHHHHHLQQPHHHMSLPPPPPAAPAQPHTQTAPQQPPPPPVPLGTNVGPPHGSTHYHVYPHPTTYVYGPPVYNDEGSTSECSAEHHRTPIISENPSRTKDLTEGAAGESGVSEDKVKSEVVGEEDIKNIAVRKSVRMTREEESYLEESSQAAKLEQTIASKAVTSAVTGSKQVAATAKQSCDSKLENIIASKEFPSDSAATTTEASETEGAVLWPKVPSYSTEQGATRSLTLESLDEMNKEIADRPLNEETSETGASEKVICSTPILELQSISAAWEAQSKVDISSSGKAITSQFSSSSESSNPSSTNESSTSSPVNEGASLIRTQPKLASRKNFSNGSKKSTTGMDIDVTCTAKDKNKASKKSLQKIARNNKQIIASGSEDYVQHKNCKEQMENGDVEKENTKGSDDNTSQEQNVPSNEDIITTSNSGQQVEESYSSPSNLSTLVSSQDVKDVHTSLFSEMNIAHSSDVDSAATSSIPSSISRKPTDLTVRCPADIGNDDSQYEILELGSIPPLANEPSSPDSLNTNQSVAGSEIAPGENLSVSESDVMNRTTSIDEVEEDLPQEVEYVIENEAAAVSHKKSQDSFDPTDGIEALATSVTQSIHISEEDNGVKHLPHNENENEDHFEKEEVIKSEDSKKSGASGAEKAADESTGTPPKQSKPSSSCTPPPPSTSSCDSGEKRQDTEVVQVPPRPQSITLAVTEWLKTQGEDALTPVLARTSSSEEFEGDVDDTTDSDDGDYDEENDEKASGKRRDVNASNLEQNQKNVYGNPWVAPSNKSGSSLCSVTATRRRSGCKKSAKKENEGRTTSLPKSDGACSRVAPTLASKITSTSSLGNSINMQPQLSINMSSCSVISAVIPDNQVENYLTDADAKHSPVSKLSTSILETASKHTNNIIRERDAGKDYDSGLELSSPESSSSSSSVVSNTKPNNTLTATNGSNKSYELADSSDITGPAVAASQDGSHRESLLDEKSEKIPLPKFIANNCHNGFIAPNPDQIFITAPLSLAKQEEPAPDIQVSNESEEGSSDKEKCNNGQSSSSSTSSRNNTAPTSPSVVNIMSPGSLTSSSIDDKDHAEICDPQRYAKYYQFGVVFDTSDDLDQGIDTAAEDDDQEADSLDDITLESPAATPTPTESSEAILHKPSVTADTPCVKMLKSRKHAKKARKNEPNLGKNEQVFVSKSVYRQEDDEEIGTFDPKLVLESRLRRGSLVGNPTAAASAATVIAEEALDHTFEEAALVARPALEGPTSHLYVNQFSLAAEMSGSDIVEVDFDTSNKEKNGYCSSLELSQESPLPPYESPASIEIPVYNISTPPSRVIRQNFYAIGDPVSGAICCSIQ